MLKKRSKKRSYEFYLLPNLITFSNLALGVMAILLGNKGGLDNMILANAFIILASIMDKLDGYVARKYNMTSDFGKQLDSLSDLISFGLAPLFLSINLGIFRFRAWAIFISLAYIIASSYRLARFNVEKESIYIRGLPITISGLTLALKHLIDIGYRYGLVFSDKIIYENILLLSILSILMVSSFQIKNPFKKELP